MSAPVSPLTAPATAVPSPERAKLHKAAEGFEAMFVRQILASARQTTFGGDKDLFGGNPLGSGDDTFTQMRDERFAEIAAHSGAFGLARQIESQLARGLNLAPASGAAPATTPASTEG